MEVPAKVAAVGGHYVLDDQIGFLLRIAMQRHTAMARGFVTA
jgi:hypothetical protein